MVKRAAAVFQESSRLYRQASEAAVTLLDAADADKEFMRSALMAHDKNGEEVLLATTKDRTLAVEKALAHLKATAGLMDMRHAVPVLMEAMDHFYYTERPRYEESSWIGIALKTAIAAVWSNRNSPSAKSKSNVQLLKLVQAAAAFEQLRIHREHAEVFGYGRAYWHNSGIRLCEDKDQQVTERWAEYASPRGEIQRTLKDSFAVVWDDIRRFLDIAADVVNGADPAAIPELKGTLFEHVRLQQFWLGVHVRLLLLVMAQKVKQGVSDEIHGIALFEELPIALSNLNVNPEVLQGEIHKLFWNEDWYRKRAEYTRSNMIVERPVLRLDSRTFVTTPFAVMDSVNCFIEHSVLGYTGLGGVKLNPAVFKAAISGPFEVESVMAFRGAQWLAGGVTEHGVWSVGSEKLVSATGDMCPGEIDVLACHPDGSYCVLAECKVLSDPLPESALRNTVSKLGQDDSEGFHVKLEKKAKWLKTVEKFSSMTIIPIVLVDRAAFMAKNPPHQVLDISDLGALLEEIGLRTVTPATPR